MKVPQTDFPKSDYIISARFHCNRWLNGLGDMWPITWAADDNLYAGAGDNDPSARIKGLAGPMWSPMNFWRINEKKTPELVDNWPIDPRIYCQKPQVDPKNGIKPAGLLSVNGTLYFAVENMNYGENPVFNRQRNVNAWIITSVDYGRSWNRDATTQNFFTGRLSSPHFIQFGRDYAGSRDEYVYATVPGADDGNSYWCNGDYLLLGRVHKDAILRRDRWEFYAGLDKAQMPIWTGNDSSAVAIFRYKNFTGENHVAYNKGIRRYLMGNYAFYGKDGEPRPYHTEPQRVYTSQLTLFEAPEPWGPWKLFYNDALWGVGDYQPNFPTKWMSEDGRKLTMISSGNNEDYCLVCQDLYLNIKETD